MALCTDATPDLKAHNDVLSAIEGLAGHPDVVKVAEGDITQDVVRVGPRRVGPEGLMELGVCHTGVEYHHEPYEARGFLHLALRAFLTMWL